MNIAQTVERAARWFPDHPAILFEGSELSYRELNLRANRLANALKANGVQGGDRIALYLPNIPHFAVCYVAALKAGAVAVSINSIFKSEEVRYIVNDSGATLLFPAGDLLPNIPRTDCPSLQHVVVCEGEPQENIPLDDWVEK